MIIDRLRAWTPGQWSACPHSVVLAVGHPDALAIGRRTLPGGVDLNRSFGIHGASERARVLQTHLADADVLLDLHQTHRPIPPLAVLPADGSGRRLARRLGLEVAVANASLVYGDAMLADWAVRRGAEALTVELGAVGDPGCVTRGLGLARAALFDERHDRPFRCWRITQVLRAPGPGLRFVRPLANESPVAAGERIARSAAGDLIAPADGVVFLPREGVAMGDAAALFAEAVS